MASRRPGQLHDPLDQIRHVTEASRLFPVAVDGERLPLQRLDDEVRDDAPVVGTHPRTIGVEDADDPRIHAVTTAEGGGHGFGEPLRLVVDAARTQGVDVAGVVLGLGMDERIAVHLRGAGQHETCVLQARQVESVARAGGARVERLDRHLQVIGRRRGRRQVKDRVDAAVDGDRPRHVVLPELEARSRKEPRDVRAPARREVVQADHGPAVRQQAFREVASQEPGPTGDDGAHYRLPTP